MAASSETVPTQEAGRPLFTPSAVAASCAGFVVIGALQALYGPTIPVLRSKFGVPPAVAGLTLSTHFAGALLGVVVYHLLRGKLRNRTLLGCSHLLLALGCLLFAFSPVWPLALCGTLAIGLGYGGLDYGLNQLFSVGFGRRSTAMLNLLHAYFGVGAVVGPALVGRLGAANYTWIFVALAAVCVLLMFPGGVGQEPPRAAGRQRAQSGTSRVLPVVAAFVGIYVLHVAVEVGVGGWEPTHLEAIGYGSSLAATATSAYWLAMTAGRFLAAPLSLRWSASAIVTVCCLGMAGFLLLAAIPAVAPYAYAGMGLMVGPIFPTCLPWLNRAAPTVSAAGAYVIAASMIGGISFPPLLGRAIEVSGVQSVPLLLFAAAVICALSSLWLRRNAPPGP